MEVVAGAKASQAGWARACWGTVRSLDCIVIGTGSQWRALSREGPAWSVAGNPGGSLVQSSRQETVGAGAGVADGDSEDTRFLGGETHRTW